MLGMRFSKEDNTKDWRRWRRRWQPCDYNSNAWRMRAAAPAEEETSNEDLYWLRRNHDRYRQNNHQRRRRYCQDIFHWGIGLVKSEAVAAALSAAKAAAGDGENSDASN